MVNIGIGLAMTGETNIETLLRALSPRLLEGTFVFCTLKNGRYGDLAHAAPVASFQESEGLTLVLSKEEADREKLNYNGLFRCITLGVHSSLEAVGLTAAISTVLAKHHISANVIAGYYHDHIFVQAEQATEAVELIQQLSEG
jgi:uncharacterized protein